MEVWEKLESLYGDDEPLEEVEDEEFDELLGSLDALQHDSERLLERKDVAQRGLRQLSSAFEERSARLVKSAKERPPGRE